MIQLAIAGATGRTGRAVVECACKNERFDVVAALTAKGDPMCGQTLQAGPERIDVSHAWSGRADVLIDFSTADGTAYWLDVCRERGIPLVTGVTGHNANQLAHIDEVSRTIPVLKASNFSIGINLLLRLVGDIARDLGPQYDIEIVETHHRNKVDAPSGTALSLLNVLSAATGRSSETNAVFGRHGAVGPRPTGQIGVHAVRLGEIVGRHEIHFSGPGETITLSHAAQSRDTFANGALRAAEWLIGRPAGLYTMRDVVTAPHIADDVAAAPPGPH